MASVQELKKKYETLTDAQQKINNQKIGLESEIKTIDGDYNEAVSKLLELTGRLTLEEAIDYYGKLKKQLEEDKESLNKKLDGYIDISSEAFKVNGNTKASSNDFDLE